MPLYYGGALALELRQMRVQLRCRPDLDDLPWMPGICVGQRNAARFSASPHIIVSRLSQKVGREHRPLHNISM